MFRHTTYIATAILLNRKKKITNQKYDPRKDQIRSAILRTPKYPTELTQTYNIIRHTARLVQQILTTNPESNQTQPNTDQTDKRLILSFSQQTQQ